MHLLLGCWVVYHIPTWSWLSGRTAGPRNWKKLKNKIIICLKATFLLKASLVSPTLLVCVYSEIQLTLLKGWLQLCLHPPHSEESEAHVQHFSDFPAVLAETWKLIKEANTQKHQQCRWHSIFTVVPTKAVWLCKCMEVSVKLSIKVYFLPV